jgi:sugar lactone lactonase YvrE
VDNTNTLIYVTDTYNHLIRKLIISSGAVSVFAGQTTSGFADGTGTDATFFLPHGVCVDSSGNLFVVEEGNDSIRKITSARVVSTFAGGTRGFADGTGTDAKFYAPYGITIHRSTGDMFVADVVNNAIRKVTSGGVVSTYAGTGSQGSTDATGTSASFFSPYAVTVDPSGNVFVADYSNFLIRKIDTSRVVTTFAGSTEGDANGVGTNAQFKSPTGVVIDAAGHLYVADYVNNVVRLVNGKQVVTTYAGYATGDADGTGTDVLFSNPFALAATTNGKVYMVDVGNNKIKSIN